jgi:spore coat protein U-like protein
MRVTIGLAVLMLFGGVATAMAQGSNCTFNATGLNLGTYTGALLTSGVGSVTATCPAGSAFQIGLNAGTGAGATTTTRLATGPASATLSYQMFQSTGRTVNWGNNAGVDTVSATSTGSAQVFSIFPKVAAGQNVAPGTYVDTVTAAITGFNNPTTTFTVTATIMPSCTLTANPLDFGDYAGLALAGTTTVSVTCTNTTAWNLGLDAGQSAGATTTTRQMTGPGGATLAYGLFLDSAHTQQWGLTLSMNTASGTGNGLAQPITVYGLIPEGVFGTPGFYVDTITATVSY